MRRLMRKIYRFFLAPILNRLERMAAGIEAGLILTVQPRIREFSNLPCLPRLSAAEFQVFSQWGEDGIIQFLLSKVPIENETFVEFGVQDYRESNTRFLLMNNDWRGLVMDCVPRHVDQIRAMPLYWKHDLTAVHAFITAANINALIKETGFEGDIGLLSIDIDGNDYWAWKAIEVISPRIVIIEYNSLFGPKIAVTIPYREDFMRTKAHYSNLYYGASLKALCRLAKEKGYVFVGCNSAGSNAFFVRRDVAGLLPELDCEAGYVESRMRESRDASGNLTYISGAKRLEAIRDQMVRDLESNTMRRIGDLGG